jgi:ParB/RepB/Spo0J family partition protein
VAVETIALDRVEKNPYRDLVGHPIPDDQLETLKASIESTGFWEGLLVRPHPTKQGRYQLAFGHARLEAARTVGGKPIKQADFIVHDIDDDAMIRAMADENISQFGRDEYATYREAVTAAVERIMGEVVTSPSKLPKYFEGSRGPDGSTILAGDAPGEAVVSRYFKGSLPLGPIRMALKEYRESGKLAKWHKAHNPKATKQTEPPKVDSKALGKFEHVHHVQAFAKACDDLSVPLDWQEGIANTVVEALKDPEPKHPERSAKSQKRNVDYQRTEKPPSERMTAHNIRRLVTESVGKRKETKAERDAMAAQAYAISIESALSEAAIGLKRAAKAAGELALVAQKIGGMHIDMTPIAKLRLADCIEAYRKIEESLRAAQKAGPNSGIRRLT